MRIYLSCGVLITQPKCFVPFLGSYPSVISVIMGAGCRVVCPDTVAPNTYTSTRMCLCICVNVCVSASISISILTSTYLLSIGLTEPRKHPGFIFLLLGAWGWRESSLGVFTTVSCFQYLFSTSSLIKLQISDGHVSTQNTVICFFPLAVK